MSDERLSIPASEVKATLLPTIWRERIPVGTLSVIAGKPGLGKSTLSVTIAAELSRSGLPVVLSNLEAMAELGRPTTAAEIAQMLDPPRQTGNVSTRLRQMEDEDPPRVRRTGNTANHGVRGGPQVEWELAAAGDEPTRPGQPLSSPQSPPPRREEMRRQYFDALIVRFEAALDSDDAAGLADRIERLLEA